MIARDELLAILERVKPARIAMVDDEGRAEWLAVPRGRGRWERLIDRTIGGRAFAELRLCDPAKNTLEVVGAAPAAEPDDAAAPAPAGGGELGHFAALLTSAVTAAVKVTTASLESTVRTMRTEARSEMTDLLTAHQAMARDAFELRARAVADLAVEQERRLALETELAEARAQLAHATAPAEAPPADAREATILRLLEGGGLGGGGRDPSQGMPSGS